MRYFHAPYRHLAQYPYLKFKIVSTPRGLFLPLFYVAIEHEHGCIRKDVDWNGSRARSTFTSCPSSMMLSSRFARCLLPANSCSDLCWKDRRVSGSCTVAASTPTSYNKPSFNRSGSFASNSSFK